MQADDDLQKDRIGAKNSLESYAFNMKQTLDDEKLKDKISSDDRKKIEDKCDEVSVRSWNTVETVRDIVVTYLISICR